GMETYRNRADLAVVPGLVRAATLRTGYIAHFAAGDSYATRLVLVNTSSVLQRVRITARGLEENGRSRPASASVERVIEANARLEEDIGQMIGLTGGVLTTGYIE